MSHNEYLHELYQDVDGTLYLDKTSGTFLDDPFLHLELNNWSPSKFKKYLKIWQITKVNLYRAGFHYAYATPPGKKEAKLIKMFGFYDTGMTISGLTLLRSELCHQQSHSSV